MSLLEQTIYLLANELDTMDFNSTDCYNDHELYLVGTLMYYIQKNANINLNYGIDTGNTNTIKNILLSYIDKYNKKTEDSVGKYKQNEAYGGNDCVNGYILLTCKLDVLKKHLQTIE